MSCSVGHSESINYQPQHAVIIKVRGHEGSLEYGYPINTSPNYETIAKSAWRRREAYLTVGTPVLDPNGSGGGRENALPLYVAFMRTLQDASSQDEYRKVAREPRERTAVYSRMRGECGNTALPRMRGPRYS